MLILRQLTLKIKGISSNFIMAMFMKDKCLIKHTMDMGATLPNIQVLIKGIGRMGNSRGKEFQQTMMEINMKGTFPMI